MRPRWIFPLFNALVGAIIGSAIGYYLLMPLAGLFAGLLAGLGLALPVEFLLGGRSPSGWLYQRRALLMVLLELPLAIFLIGPYAFVVMETRPDRHPVCCETPLDYGAASYEELRAETAGGLTLVGWYVPPKENLGPLVILLHGARGDRRDTSWHAARLIEAGFGVAMYDQPGLGESEGELASTGWLDGPDLLDVADLLASRPEIDPGRIGLVGLSAGGHTALNAAYLAPGRFAALWLDGVQAQTIEDFPEASNAGERFATFINWMVLNMSEFQIGRAAPPAFSQILAQLEGPRVMLVAGELEPFEAQVYQEYSRLAGPETRLWVIDNAWHLGGPAVIPESYAAAMLAFFEDSLGN